jgi:DNA-binding NarL/FixJ family response regulator
VIRDRYPGTTVLVVSGGTDKAAALTARQADVAGACGKDPEFDRIVAALDVIAAVRSAHGDERGDENPLATLTPRETEVLGRLTAGQSTKRMAREMDVTTETLRTYVKNVLGKLGAHSRLEAAVLASRLVPPRRAEPRRDHPLLATLTPREREVLTYLASGSRLRDIASHLHMSLKTINTHLHNLRGKLGVHSTLEAVALAQTGLARPATSDDAARSP